MKLFMPVQDKTRFDIPTPPCGFSMREVADLLGVSYMSVFRLTRRGLLRPSQALRKKIFSLEEIQRFLRETQ